MYIYICKQGLKSHHKQDRNDWVEKYMPHWDKWLIVLISDEIKWNLDFPASWYCYFNYLRNRQRTFFCGRQGSKSLIVLGRMTLICHSCLATIRHLCWLKQIEQGIDRQYSNIYFGDILRDSERKFQHNHALIHYSHSTKQWLSTKKFNVSHWSISILVINSNREHVGILTREVYQNGKQCDSTKEIKVIIVKLGYYWSPITFRKIIISI